MARWVLGTFAIVLGAVLYFGFSALPIGTGFAARYVCTALFEQGEDPDIVFRREVAPEHPLFASTTFRVDPNKRLVEAHSLFGLASMQAVHREGFGCTLLVGQSIESLRAQTNGFQLKTPRSQPVVTGLRRGNDARWTEFLDRYLDEPSATSLRNTKAILVAHRGDVLVEGYAEGISMDTPLLGWSMTKSVLALLVGALVQEGRASLTEAALFENWRGADDLRRTISIQDLLEMKSGLAFSEVYGPLEDATDMLYGSFSFSDFAMNKELEHPPGEHWMYSSGTSNILSRLVFERSGGSLVANREWIHKVLFQPLGIHHAFIEADPSGVIVGSSYMYASARDWLALGTLILNDGVIGGQRLVPEGWIESMTKPVKGAPQGKYGFHVWLNSGAPDNPSDRLFPELPTDLILFRGHNEQLVAVSPSQSLVAIRLGATLDDSWQTQAFLADVLELVKQTERTPQSDGKDSQ